jgi:RecG-like helicase
MFMYDLEKFVQLPDEQQQEQMRKWISELVTASEDERQEGLRQLLLANAKLGEPDKTKVIKVRTLVTSELPKEQMKIIVLSRFHAMQNHAEINEADRQIVFTVMQQMPFDIQKTVMQVISELRDEMSSKR